MVISVQGFSGVAPRLAPYALRENQAQTALNVRLWSGILEPLPGLTKGPAITAVSGNVKTLYLRNPASPSSPTSWFSSATLTDMVKTQLAGDTTGRLYYTDGGYPKFTDASLGTSYYTLGVPAPQSAPVLAAGAWTATDAAAEIYFDITDVAITDTLTIVVGETESGPFTVAEVTAAAIAALFSGVSGVTVADSSGKVHFTSTATGAAAKLKLIWTVPDGLKTYDPTNQTYTTLYSVAGISFLGYYNYYSASGGNVTIATGGAHGLKVGDRVSVGFYNEALTVLGDMATYVVTATADTTHFTFVAIAPASSGFAGVTTAPSVTIVAADFGNFEPGDRVAVTVGSEPQREFTITSGAGTVPPAATKATLMEDFKSIIGLHVYAISNDIRVTASDSFSDDQTLVIKTADTYTLTDKVTEVANVTGADGEAVIATRGYVSTFVRVYNGWEEESAPSLVALVDAYDGQSVSISALESAPTGSHNITHRRIYRTSTGSQGTNYYFVAQIPVANTTYTDILKGESLGEAIPSLEWTEPPAGLEGIVSIPNGAYAAFKGKNIYFCEPFIPHAWPEKYIQTVEYDIVGLAVLGTNVLVLTKGTPSIIQGTDPANMAMTRLDIEQSCVSRRSICRFGNGVAYASPDGLIYVDSGGSNILTAPFVAKKEWNELLSPTSLHGYEHDGRYYGFHSTGGFILDPADTSGALTVHDVICDAAFSDLLTDTLYIVSTTTQTYTAASTVYSFGTGSALDYTWKSKFLQLPYEDNLGAAQVIAQSYDDLEFKYWADGVLKLTKTVTSSLPFRLPSGFRGRFVEFQLAGTDFVNQVHIAKSVTELRSV